MNKSLTAPAFQGHSSGLVLIVAALLIGAAALTAVQWSAIAPAGDWLRAALTPDPGLLPDVLIHEAALPRVAVALFSGGALALSGTVFQHVLRNPLAEPGTLGVAAGAYLALACANLWLPGSGLERSGIALAGGSAALLVVLLLSRPSRFSPSKAIVAGLLVTQVCAAIATAITLFHEQTSTGLMIWASGSLDQHGWAITRRLAIQTIPVAALVLVLARPMALLDLDDTSVTSLGLRVGPMRLLLLLLAVALGAFVVSAVGIIGFVGLAAPAIARALGARRLRERLLWAPLLGAALLWLTDAGVQVTEPELGHVPAGAAAALLGAPLMLWLVPRVRHGFETAATWPSRLRRPTFALVLLFVTLACATSVSVFVGRDQDGLHVQAWAAVRPFLFWRVPRMIASLSAGAMLGLAGAMLQRLADNVMASPELLGISSGAMLGLIASIFFVPSGMAAAQTACAAAGSIATLAAVMILSVQSRFAPSQVLLVGLGLTAGTTALIGLWIGMGDPRAYLVLRWLAGTTDLTTPPSAGVALTAASLCFVAAMTMTRWLAIAPVGAAVSVGLGLGLVALRSAILIVVAVATGTTATIVGPLSFVGLLAPSQARLMGFSPARLHLISSAVIGALVMVVADWLSRVIIFPYPFPAGLLASLVAAPALVALLRRE